MEEMGLSAEEVERANDTFARNLRSHGISRCESRDGCLVDGVSIAGRTVYYIFQVAAQMQVVNVVSVRIPPLNLLSEIEQATIPLLEGARLRPR